MLGVGKQKLVLVCLYILIFCSTLVTLSSFMLNDYSDIAPSCVVTLVSMIAIINVNRNIEQNKDIIKLSNTNKELLKASAMLHNELMEYKYNKKISEL